MFYSFIILYVLKVHLIFLLKGIPIKQKRREVFLDGLKKQVDFIESKKAYFDLSIATEDGITNVNFLEMASSKEDTSTSGMNTFDNVDIDASYKSIFARIEENCPKLVSYSQDMDKKTLQETKKSRRERF